MKKNKYELSLQGLIHHVTVNGLKNERELDYYSDFTGTDSYNYFIEFNDTIQLKNPLKIDVSNEYGQHQVDISQMSSKVVKVSSYNRITAEKISAQKITSAIDIFNSINKIENYKLIIERL